MTQPIRSVILATSRLLFWFAIDWTALQQSALGIDVSQRMFADSDDAALFTSDAANWPFAFMTFDSGAAGYNNYMCIVPPIGL